LGQQVGIGAPNEILSAIANEEFSEASGDGANGWTDPKVGTPRQNTRESARAKNSATHKRTFAAEAHDQVMGAQAGRAPNSHLGRVVTSRADLATRPRTCSRRQFLIAGNLILIRGQLITVRGHLVLIRCRLISIGGRLITLRCSLIFPGNRPV
jgi:hypothetical protein